MASLTVRAGLSTGKLTLPAASLIVVGQAKHIKSTKFEGALAAKFGGALDAAGWAKAVELLPPNGSLPLVFNQAKVCAVPDTASRYNSPSNAVAIFRQLRGSKPHNGSTQLNVVVVAEYAHVQASVAAVARAFPLYSRKTTENTLKEVHIEVVVADGKTLTEKDVSFLSAMATAVRETGRLIDAPANEMTTDAMVREAEKVAGEVGAKSTVIRGEELRERGFGGIYHVGKAGPTPPAFVVLSHKPAGSNHKYALVGKGIVYDTGGLQIKGKTGMPGMKRDMGGAAGMLNAFATLVKAGFKEELHCCLCLAENNVSPIANKPDDIIRMLSGKTVEINNTDAEGRLVLGDGVYYAKTELKAQTIFDMATLTGAQAYVSGRMHAAVMTNAEEWEAKTAAAGRRSGDMCVPMMFAPDLHFSDFDSPVADMRNSNLGKMEGPPSSIAGLFIGSHIEFGEGLDWVHLDIAAPAEYQDRGTGFGPSLFSSLLGKHTDVPLLQL